MIDRYKKLEEVLKKDEDLVSTDGDLLINEVFNKSNHLDEKLLKILMENEEIRNMFFKNINGIEVFDKQEFNWTINSKNFLPNSYTKFSNDIGLVDEKNNFIKNREDVTLSFPNKDCFLEFDSTSEKESRKEIFFNETLAKDEIDCLKDNKTYVNAKKIDKSGEHNIVKFDKHDNLLIKGNNLLAMYSLLPRYTGQIKLMYWDILYNTENDQVPYNDSFKHSSWLVMMKNRLKVAYELLAQDGTICIQCDDNEMAYLKVLCDEIFKRENKLSTISVKVKAPGGVGQESFLFDVVEYILVYAKDRSMALQNIDNEYLMEKTSIEETNAINQYTHIFIPKSKPKYINTLNSERNGDISLYEIEDYEYSNIEKGNRTNEFYKVNIDKICRTTNPQGGLITKLLREIPSEGVFKIEYKPSKGKKADSTIEYYIINGALVVWLKDSSKIEDGELFKLQKKTNFWTDNLFQGIASEGGITLKNGKKPEALIKRIIEMLSKPNDIVLDCYLGSGTTAAVAMKMNRQFIGIEQLNEHVEKAKQRLKTVVNGDTTGISKQVGWNGGGSFTCFELAKNNQNMIEKIQKAKDEELSDIYKELENNDFLNWRIDLEILKKKEHEFEKLDVETQRNILMELLEKNLLYVNYSDIDDVNFNISEEDKEFTKSFYEE